MSDPTRESLMRALAHAPSLTRTQLRKRINLARAIATTSVFGVFISVGGTDHSEPRALGTTAAIACGVLMLAALSNFAIAKRESSPLGPSGRRLAGVVASTPCVLFAWLALMKPTATYAEFPVGFRCFALTVVMGGLLLGAMTYARRGSDPVHPGWLGGALGASAAAWSAALVAAWCPLYDLPHVLLGHVAPIIGLSALGCALARPLLRL